MIADYAEILRLYRKFRARPDEPLWVTFVMLGQEMERMRPEPKPWGDADPRGPFFSTKWEREDYERRQRGEPERGPSASSVSPSQSGSEE